MCYQFRSIIRFIFIEHWLVVDIFCVETKGRMEFVHVGVPRNQQRVGKTTHTHTHTHTHITNTTLLVLAHKNPLRQQTHLLTVCSLRSGPHTQMSMTWVNKSLIKPSTSQLSLMLTRFLHFTVTAARKTHHRQRQRDEWACRQSGSSHVCEQNAWLPLTLQGEGEWDRLVTFPRTVMAVMFALLPLKQYQRLFPLLPFQGKQQSDLS